MKNAFTISALAVSLFVVPQVVRADGAAANPVTHPVMAFDEHRVKTNEKDMQKDETKIIQSKQSMMEREAFVNQRKSEYEKSLKDNGMESEVTKMALVKYQDAQKSFKNSVHSNRKARHEMKKDAQELDHAKVELNEDRKVAAQK